MTSTYRATLPRDVDPVALLAADTVARCAGWTTRYAIHLYDAEFGTLVGVLGADAGTVCDALTHPEGGAVTAYARRHMRDRNGLDTVAVAVLAFARSGPLLPLEAQRRQFTPRAPAAAQRFAIARLPPFPTYASLLPIPGLAIDQLHMLPDDPWAVRDFATDEAGKLTPRSGCTWVGVHGRIFQEASRHDVNPRGHRALHSIRAAQAFPKESHREARLYNRLLGGMHIIGVFLHVPQRYGVVWDSYTAEPTPLPLTVPRWLTMKRRGSHSPQDALATLPGASGLYPGERRLRSG